MRVVIDTNIVASAVYFGGKPYQFLHLLMEGKIDVVASDEIVKEYDRTLVKLQNKYPKLSKRIPFAEIVANLEIINVSSNIQVCRDPKDDMFLSCAVDGKCIYILSGDDDLLTIGEYEGIEIMTLTQFFERYKEVF